MNWLLRLFGASVGPGVRIFPSVRIMIPWNLKLGEMATVGDAVMLYALGPIQIGQSATISQGAHLCAGSHDHTHPNFPLQKAQITIGDSSWICADAFVGPNVTIGEGAILGARGVAVRNVAPWTIVAGNPAKPIGVRKLSKRPPESSHDVSS